MANGNLNIILDAALGSSEGFSFGSYLHATLENLICHSNGDVIISGEAASILEDAAISYSKTRLLVLGSLNESLEPATSKTYGEVFTGADAPYQDVSSWNVHPAIDLTTKVRLGNLRGIFKTSNEFGLYAGDGVANGETPSSSSKYIRLGNHTNEFHNVPFRMYSDGQLAIEIEPDTPKLSMGLPAPSGYNSGTGIWQGKDTDGQFKWRVGGAPGSSLPSIRWENNELILDKASLSLSGENTRIALGNPPPTASNKGTGIWIDSTGLYGLFNDNRQVFIDTVNGAFYAGDVKLDGQGIGLGSQLVINSRERLDVDVELAFWRTTGGNASIFWNGDTMWTTKQFRPSDILIARISAAEPTAPAAGMIWVQP